MQAACWGRPASLQSKDIDVRLPSLDDFQTQDIQARIFINSTNLYIIIGQIAELRSQNRPILLEDLSNISIMLRDWLHSLPGDLRLYDSTGIRRPYYRPVCEVHIIYFTAIILIQSMQKQTDKYHRTSLPSVVASSCMVSLYEEIYYRQHAPFLLHIHGFFIMVAAVSQIYYRPRTPERIELLKQELDSLCSILERMRNKYGGAGMVLTKILWLRSEVDKARQRELANPQQANLQDESSRFLSPDHENLRELFSFPVSLCTNMDLLEVSMNDNLETVSTNLFPWEEDMASWTFQEDISFANMFEMDSETFNSTYSGVGERTR